MAEQRRHMEFRFKERPEEYYPLCHMHGDTEITGLWSEVTCARCLSKRSYRISIGRPLLDAVDEYADFYALYPAARDAEKAKQEALRG